MKKHEHVPGVYIFIVFPDDTRIAFKPFTAVKRVML